MKRVTFGDGLVGNLYERQSDTVIIMSHGFRGEKTEGLRFTYLAERFKQDVLTIDYLGCGESKDAILTPENQLESLEAALDIMNDYPNIILFGHSIGAYFSIKACDERIKAMIFTAPVTSYKGTFRRSKYNLTQLKELRTEGKITVIKDKGPREKLVISKEMLELKKTINQKELLGNIQCPVLIFHSIYDRSVPYGDSERAMGYFDDYSQLVMLEDKTHELSNSLDRISTESNQWIRSLKGVRSTIQL